MKMEKISVIVVDDQQLFLESMKTFMSSFENVTLLGCARNESELKELMDERPPDVLLLDVEMPSREGKDGLELARNYKEVLPDMKIISMSANTQSHVVRELLVDIQVDGFIDKYTTSRADLEKALDVALSGQVYVSPSIENRARTVFDMDLLTEKECQVLQKIVEGYINKEIASAFDSHLKTIDNQRQSIYKKLNCKNTADLSRVYYRYMYLHHPEEDMLPNFKKHIKCSKRLSRMKKEPLN